MSRKALVPIELPGNPVNPLEAAPKQYVDAQAGGGGLPVGGVTGDILVKITSTNGDALWRTAMPKLELTSTTALASLATTDTGLMLGPINSTNMVFDRNTIQVRNNGAAATISINELGGIVDLSAVTGDVVIGSASTPGVSAIGLRVLAPATGTTKRASVRIGDWSLHQDVSSNGTLDFCVYRNGVGAIALWSDTGGLLTLSSGTIRLSDTQWLRSNSYQFTSATGAAMGSLDDNGFNMSGTRYIGFPTYGGGWYMSDATWIRAYGNKNIYTAGAIIATAGSVCAGGATPGSWKLHVTGTAYVSSTLQVDGAFNGQAINGALQIKGNYGAAAGNSSWASMQFIAISAAAGTTGVAGCSFNPAAAGVAPIMRCYGATGEGFHFRSNPDTAYIGLNASAFAVGSSIRTKQEIEELDDKIVMDLARQVQPIRFRYNERPQTLRTEIENPENEDWVSFDHDCSIDKCDGDEFNPCCIALNDTPRFGFTAEDMALIMPEIVELDEYRLPSGIDTAQVASVALAGVGALVRRVEQLEKELDGLRN